MTQTNDGFSASEAKVEISADGMIWSDISGSSASVGPADQERQSGETYTHGGDTAIVTAGKRKNVELEVDVVYTEGVPDPFEIIRAAHDAKTPYYLRWTPKGEGVDNTMFTTEAGIITGLIYPDTEAESGEPTMFGFTLWTPKISETYLRRMLLADGTGHWLFADGSTICYLVGK